MAPQSPRWPLRALDSPSEPGSPSAGQGQLPLGGQQGSVCIPLQHPWTPRLCCLGNSFWLGPGGFVPSLGKKGDFQPELQTGGAGGIQRGLKVRLLGCSFFTPGCRAPLGSGGRDRAGSPCPAPLPSIPGSAGMVCLGNGL